MIRVLEAYRPPVPAGFCGRVMSAVHGQPGTHVGRRFRRWAFLRGRGVGVPVAAGVLAGAFLLFFFSPAFPGRDRPFLDDAPVAAADSYGVPRGETLRVPANLGVLANDRDPDTDPGRLEARLLSPPSRSSEFRLQADGGFTYRSEGDGPGNDRFTYRPFDGTSLGAPALVVVHIL